MMEATEDPPGPRERRVYIINDLRQVLLMESCDPEASSALLFFLRFVVGGPRFSGGLPRFTAFHGGDRAVRVGNADRLAAHEVR